VVVTLFVLLLVLGVSSAAHAESIAGVCPDGSMYIVTKEADIPCARSKQVDPAEMPPIRPQLLPRPYTWHVDQEARNPHNPYNLVDPAAKIRALRSGEPATQAGTPNPVAPAPVGTAPVGPGPTGIPTQPTLLALDDQELRDLARLVVLRQQASPAELLLEDIHGNVRLAVEFAYSPAFEERVRRALGPDADELVLAFLARSSGAESFHPNFLVVQGATTFRPDPDRAEEQGILLGEAGEQEDGGVVLGYLVVPGRFDPRVSIDLWWNDRSVRVTLDP
jgi:hypothetical protein